MNMPGFIAEAALYKAEWTYRATVNLFASQVLPQASFSECVRSAGMCNRECPGSRDPRHCNDKCNIEFQICLDSLDGGGNGSDGSPGGFHCLPRCSRCLPDLDSPTGRSKTCVTFDCGAFEREC